MQVIGVDLWVGGRMGSVCHGNVGVRGEIQKEKGEKEAIKLTCSVCEPRPPFQ